MSKVINVDNSKIMNDKRIHNAKDLLQQLSNDNPIIQDINDPQRYGVKSTKSGSYYEVFETNNIGWICNCPDYTIRCVESDKVKCKHIHAIRLMQKAKQTIPKGVLNL